jgi:tRNA uridine 5-carboxymethylaminomethyl modification enzyme
MKERREKLKRALEVLKDWKMSSNVWRTKLNMPQTKSSQPRSAFEVLAVVGPPNVEEICDIDLQAMNWIKEDPDLCNRVKIEAVYDNAIKNQENEISEIKRDESLLIPKDLDYFSKSLCLSFEEREKLRVIKPHSIADASRIPHITPSTVMRLLRYVKQNHQL